MGLFKSKAQRRLEREIEIRKGLQLIRRNIRQLQRHEEQYLLKAQRAKQIGARDQLALIRASLKRTAGQRRLLAQQLLAIETALQIKNQAEAHAQFARSLKALSRAISTAFGALDLTQTQREFEQAILKAESLEARMELFVEMTTDTMVDSHSGQTLIADEEIDRLIDGRIDQDEKIDQEIAAQLREIEKELGKTTDPS